MGHAAGPVDHRPVGHTIVVDFDGTLVKGAWPGIGDWMPGAIDAMFTLNERGYHIIVDSARLNRYDPWTGEKRPSQDVLSDWGKMREMFDKAGLTFVDIWMSAGKPSGMAYIDDRGIHYTGRPGSWRAVLEQIEVRAASETAWSAPITHSDQDWSL